MKAVVIKPFLDGRNRAAPGQVIEMEESRFSELAANGLVKAWDGATSAPFRPPEPEKEAAREEKEPSEDESEVEETPEDYPTRRGRRK